jgi:hypothetical protein
VNPEDRDALVKESTRWMAAGFDAMAGGDWQGAAGIFRAAAESRERLPWRTDEEAAWLLSASWLNLGDVLLRMENTAVLGEALEVLDRTLRVMACLNPACNPAFVDRMILTWLNRAAVFHGMGDAEGSLRDFAEGEALLAKWGETDTPGRRFLAAMLRVNRARTLVLAVRPLEAWQEASRGVSHLRGIPPTPDAALAGILARSIQCRALAMLLDEPGGADKVGDWIAEATDSAEQALSLVRATGFRGDCVADLVRYGAIIYRACQPHFLGEFLVEWLGPAGPLAGDTALKKEMSGILWLSITDAEQKVLAAPHETEFVERQTRIVAALQEGLKSLA